MADLSEVPAAGRVAGPRLRRALVIPEPRAVLRRLAVSRALTVAQVLAVWRALTVSRVLGVARLLAVARVLAVMLVVACGALAAGCSGPARLSAAPNARHVTIGASRSAASASPSLAPAGGAVGTPSAPASVIPVPPPPPGLPQTRARPSAGTPVFRAEMTDLWAAIATGQPAVATQSFFPLSAYKQVKAIADPAADWNARLLGDYRLDIAAAHRLLGPAAAAARLVRVIVPSAAAAWIEPGVCYNSVGYWHVAGARLVYRLHGRVKSIGIASMISWRGQWYVVHLGAVVRNGSRGIVDAPAAGPGVPGPPGGC